jgi:anti-sigma factor RsiW
MAKLNHQPFEDWLLSREALSPDEAQQLQEHLQNCQACTLLSVALREVDRELHAALILTPAPGFATRWMGRLEAERRQLHRRQTFLVMFFSIGGAMFLLTLLSLAVFPVLRSPWPVILAFLYELTSSFTVASVLGEALATVLKAVFEMIPATQWAAIWVAFAGLGVLWVVAMHRLILPRRIPL